MRAHAFLLAITKNMDLVRTSSLHGNQSLVLLKQNTISEVLEKVRVSLVWLSTMSGRRCSVLTRIAVHTWVCFISESSIANGIQSTIRRHDIYNQSCKGQCSMFIAGLV